MPRVVVIGGGVTGLVAAFRTAQHPGIQVTLLEAGSRLGGKIDTVALDGVRVELGPDAFLPRDDRPLQLCREVGLADELVEPSDFGGWVYRTGRLTRFPSGTVLGFPASPRALATSSILSPAGRARAAADLLRLRPLSGPDVSVGQFARGRLGAQVVERLVDPLLAGTRGGHVDDMSLAAAIPPVDAAARSHRSVIFGLARTKNAAASAPRFYAPRGGMRRLIEALEDGLGDIDVRMGSPATSVRKGRAGFDVLLADGSLRADAIIVTTPARAAAGILKNLSREAAAGLSTIAHASSAVVNLLFPADAVQIPPGGSGFLVPSSERMTLSGCTWFSRKWPALAADDGRITLRCFVGRGRRDPALGLGDRDLEGVVIEELRKIVPISAEPAAVSITRWEEGLPLYPVGHLDRVAQIEASLASMPQLRLAGASYRGSGIPDCIVQAERAATATVTALQR